MLIAAAVQVAYHAVLAKKQETTVLGHAFRSASLFAVVALPLPGQGSLVQYLSDLIPRVSVLVDTVSRLAAGWKPERALSKSLQHPT